MSDKLVAEKTVEMPDPEMVGSFSEALEDRQSAKAHIKLLEQRIEECDRRLTEIMNQNGFKKVTCQGWTISMREGSERRTIDPVRLLAAGVPASTIETCTKITPTKGGISVRKSEDKDEFTEWVKEVRAEAGVKNSDDK